LYRLRGDILCLEQMCFNLIDNVLQFTPVGEVFDAIGGVFELEGGRALKHLAATSLETYHRRQGMDLDPAVSEIRRRGRQSSERARWRSEEDASAHPAREEDL
jgi:hypothetical protein